MLKVFRTWHNMEALKMKCNKRNRKFNCAIFRESNLNQISNVLLNWMRLFFIWMVNYQTKKVFSFRFWTHFFLHFWQIFQNEMSHFFRMALVQFFISYWAKFLKLIKLITQLRLSLLNWFLLLVLSTLSAFLKSLSDYFSVGLIRSLFLTNFQC